MDSLQDILNRVLQNSAEVVAQRVEAKRPSRPLRDPGSGAQSQSAAAVNLFGDISSAIQNIQSPETAAALQAQATPEGAYADRAEMADTVTPSFPAGRKTTLADDFQALNAVTSVTQTMATEATTMLSTIGQVSAGVESFHDAVSDLARSASEAASELQSVAAPVAPASPVQRMTESLSSQIQPEQKRRSMAGVIPWGSYPRVDGFEPPSSPAENPREPGRIQQFMNSSSIMDGIRGFLGQVLNRGSANENSSAGEEMGRTQGSGFDRLLAQTYRMFRNMDEGPDNSNSFRNRAKRRIGRAGRRMLSRAFRNRLRNQMSGGGGGTGGSPPPSGNSGFRSFFGGGSAGGGAAAGGGGALPPAGGAGGGAGGAAMGGAAAGGGAGGMGAILGGVALGFVAIVAVAAMVANALYKLGMQGYETALRVAQFDGQLAGAKAQLDVSRLMRDIQTARTLSESGSGFMKALDKLEAALRPITDGALNAGLVFMTEVVLQLTAAFQMLLKVTVLYVKFLDLMTFGQVPNGMIKKLEDIANGVQPPQPNLPPAGFHDMFLNLPPAAPPRPPIGPLGGGNRP